MNRNQACFAKSEHLIKLFFSSTQMKYDLRGKLSCRSESAFQPISNLARKRVSSAEEYTTKSGQEILLGSENGIAYQYIELAPALSIHGLRDGGLSGKR